jgi:DNA end-binding protein Ku
MEYDSMAPRPFWKGYLRLSLVSCPIQLFPATLEREKVRFHQINKRTGHRIKYCKLDAQTGEQVDPEDIVMGYEIAKGRYIEVTENELEAVTIEGSHIIEIEQFVRRNDINDLYLNHPYYMTPDGEIGRQAYVVIREAMEKEGMVALGRVILTTREHVIAIEPHGQGLLGITLRYPYEIRKGADYFGDLQDERVPKEMLDLATHIVATRSGHFRPEKFEDRYELALRELIKRKQRGEKIVKPRERPSAKVIDLMEALRQTAAAGRGPARRHPQQASAEDKRGRARRTNAQARKAS